MDVAKRANILLAFETTGLIIAIGYLAVNAHRQNKVRKQDEIRLKELKKEMEQTKFVYQERVDNTGTERAAIYLAERDLERKKQHSIGRRLNNLYRPKVDSLSKSYQYRKVEELS